MNSKNQSIISIGIGLIVIGVALMLFVLSDPKKPIDELTTDNTTVAFENSSVTSADNSAVSSTTSQQNNVTASQESLTITVTYPLDLNTCTMQELMSIKGVGESRASAIIQYRDYLGRYTSVEQLKDIKGIGESLYEGIAPYVKV